MKVIFIFFLRLFFCLVFAKFILRAVGQDSQNYLIALTLLLLGNIYWFDYLQYRSRIAFRLRKLEKPAANPEAAKPEEAPSPEKPSEV
jgi:hypothetical protein